MLLAVDIGNTHTVFGLFSGDALACDWRITTRRAATADEVGIVLGALFREADVEPEAVDGMIVSSVVPELDSVYRAIAQRQFDVTPLAVGPGIKTGIPIHYENPHEVGADRIVNAVAATHRHGAPVIVLDFGTATTFDVVGPGGEYLGGVIVPGVGLSADALFAKAARLHRVDVRRPDRVVGRTTEQSIQSGLYHGYASLVDGTVRRIRAEMGCDAPVVATGGLATIFAPEMDFLTELDPKLTLDGLRLIWEKNRR